MPLGITRTRRGEPAGLRDAVGPPAQVVPSPLKKKKQEKKHNFPACDSACVSAWGAMTDGTAAPEATAGDL